MDLMDWSAKEGIDCDTKPKRKRQRLDHLSQEEKLMRRKLKNRMAAQSARDRKKVKMNDLESEIVLLAKQRNALLNQNESLKQRNALLEQQNQELRQRVSLLEEPRPAPVKSEVSGSDAWIETLESAELISVPQQKEQVSTPVTRTPSLTTRFAFWWILQNLVLCSMFSVFIQKNCSIRLTITMTALNCRLLKTLSANHYSEPQNRHHIWDQLKTWSLMRTALTWRHYRFSLSILIMIIIIIIAILWVLWVLFPAIVILAMNPFLRQDFQPLVLQISVWKRVLPNFFPIWSKIIII